MNGKYETIATIKGRKNNIYKDTTVKNAKKYYYKIEVIAKLDGKKGYSGDSEAVSGKTLKSTSIKTITSEKSKKIKITWKKISDVTGYQIYRSTSKKGTYEKITIRFEPIKRMVKRRMFLHIQKHREQRR